ncbi:MAG: bifunctional demethylmenaquinone methyltransferase/2-methoxy-6-polyprenyl-1,4-benzoquinol methylase UbiE [Bacteroidia bacterium]
MAATVKPDPRSESSKKQQVEEMFDAISPRYDFLNHALSLGIDYSWRTKVRKCVAATGAKKVMDVATGTGDLALELMKIEGLQVTGVDISAGMLEVGKVKIRQKGFAERITMQQADAEHLPFEDHTFDAITVSFGVRNFGDLKQGLSDMRRVLKPGGQLFVLEFSQPKSRWFSALYWFYFKYILPVLGRLLSRSVNAYTYLPASVKAFPEGKEFASIAQEVGYSNVTYTPITMGICTLYECSKG